MIDLEAIRKRRKDRDTCTCQACSFGTGSEPCAYHGEMLADIDILMAHIERLERAVASLRIPGSTEMMQRVPILHNPGAVNKEAVNSDVKPSDGHGSKV